MDIKKNEYLGIYKIKMCIFFKITLTASLQIDQQISVLFYLVYRCSRLYYRCYSVFLIFCWTIVLDMTFSSCGYMDMAAVLKLDLIG
jgi:hypothetical protein